MSPNLSSVNGATAADPNLPQDLGLPKRSPLAALLARATNPRGITDPKILCKHIAGKKVLVTGASYGIGRATAELLGSGGADVLLVARTADALKDTSRSIEALGGRAWVYPTDLTRPTAVDEMTEAIHEQHGAVDILVNNAGKSIRRSMELSLDRFQDFQRTMDINYLGPVKLLLNLLPQMQAKGDGHIINISTSGVRIPPGPYWGAYQASKGAYDILIRSIAPELRHRGIDFTSIYMGLVFTRMSAPTYSSGHYPGLYPEEAAGLVGRAAVERPRDISPWWADAADTLTSALRGPVHEAMSLLFPYTKDTASARAAAGKRS